MRDREKKRGLILVDWLIILLVVILALLGAYYFYQRSRDADATEEITYTLCLSGVKLTEEELPFSVGATVTNANGTATLGRVSDIEKRAHFVASVKGGKVVFLAHPDRSDLYVTVVGSGIFQLGDGIRIQDIRIAAGSRGDFRIGNYSASGASIVSVIRREGET